MPTTTLTTAPTTAPVPTVDDGCRGGRPARGATVGTDDDRRRPLPAADDGPTSSIGGSITVRVADGQISLVGDRRTPTAGWSTRIDDNGPDRVRVRFELDDRRSEIRVDLIDGEPVERITED